MAQTAADVLIDTIHDWGVDVVFGLPGDGINGIMEALRTRQDRIRFVQVRHEESAALMACAYARFTGKLGVCLATSGPGAIHLLNGLYDAKLDQLPVLAITGMAYHDLIGTHTQQDVATDKLFIDVAKYNERVMGPSHVENVADLACRTALTYRGVAHIAFPLDLQEQSATSKRVNKRNIPHHTSDAFARSARLPDDDALARAAEIVNAGDKVAILAGQGALHAQRELERAAETVGAPIVKALLGKAAVPDDSPYTTGGIGLLGTRPSQEALEDCDTLLIVGSSFPYIEFLPKPGQARGVQIDLDPMRIGLRYPVEVGLVGDSARTLAALLPRLQHKRDRSFLEKAQADMKAWNALMDERAGRTDVPMKPQLFAAPARRRDRRLRQRHHHDLVGAPHPRTPRTTSRRLGQPRHHGVRIAVRDRRPDRVSGSPVRGVRGRRRLLDADGGAGDVREVPAPREGLHRQERHARADQVGADGVPRQPRIRLRAAAHRFRGRRAGVWCAGVHDRTTERLRSCHRGSTGDPRARRRPRRRGPVRAAPTRQDQRRAGDEVREVAPAW
jgi:hypothetical protein